MNFRLLGPVEAFDDDGRPVTLGGPRQRALLALLLAHRGSVVSLDRIVDELWDGAAPARASSSVPTYVSRLRSALAGDGTISLRARAGGYVLQCDGERIDSVRFERLAAAGRARLAAGSADASALLGEALSLFGGSPLTGVDDLPFARLEATRLTELRLIVLEDWIDAELACGRHADVLAQLVALTAEHPLRERLWAACMLALYRCGRQADALATFTRFRRYLNDELGIEPGVELRALQRRILEQSSRLAPPPAGVAAQRGAVPRACAPRRLRARLTPRCRAA